MPESIADSSDESVEASAAAFPDASAKAPAEPSGGASVRGATGRAAAFVGRFSAEPAEPTLALLAALRADLDAAGFRVARIEALWEQSAVDGRSHPGRALQRGHRAPALLALDHVLAGLGDDAEADATRALAALVRVFVLGAPADRAALELALPALGVDGAVELGLLRERTGATAPLGPTAPLGDVSSLVDLRPYAFADASGEGEWWIASDLGELALVGDSGAGPALAEDHVLGVGGATTTLSGLLLQRAAGRTLDLGTGSGIQALHAARFSERVVATDISERALAFARFTAALNGVDGIEFRLGSLYEPVAGERFDRIVSNPPFVITPRRPEVPSYEYRDGGMAGDELVESVMRGAAEHLEPGGIAQLLANWEYRVVASPDTGEGIADGLERVIGWLEDGGLEYWIVERERQDPSEYAETWIRDGGTRPGTAEFERLHAAWLEDFAERGVESVGFGYVLLRRPANGEPARLARAERLHGPLGGEPGGLAAHLERSLAAIDAIEPLDDTALRGIRLEVAPDVTEERHHWPGAEQPTVILLRQGGGFGRVVDAGTALAAFVGAADGELPTGILSDAIAELLEADAEALWTELSPTLRELVAGGLLRPADAAAD
ncbi:methyltransferase [Agromyces mediolanus]|uniref:methyltransferase n=1 Tax=Agromyces mediolanus TaxID=41986 RepID=UPI003832B5AB